MGIDIELIRPTALKIAHKFLSEAEQKDLEINNERSATLCWSIKEAVYKYCGQKSMIFKKDIFIQKIEYKTDCSLASVNITLEEYAITIPVFFQLLDNILFSWMYNK